MKSQLTNVNPRSSPKAVSFTRSSQKLNVRVKCVGYVCGDSQNSKRGTIIKYPYRISDSVSGGEMYGI